MDSSFGLSDTIHYLNKESNMRKIETQTVYPFLARDNASQGNSASFEGFYLLHGHRIAERLPHGVLLDTAGWMTRTTGSRLRAIVAAMGRTDVCVRAKDYCLGLDFLDADGKVIRRVEFGNGPILVNNEAGARHDGHVNQFLALNEKATR